MHSRAATAGCDHELGAHAVEQLLYSMNSRVRRENAITLAPSLVIRQSTVRSTNVDKREWTKALLPQTRR
jgi:hypothetical protein